MGRKDDRQGFWLSENSDRRRIRDAENARRNRAEINKALSHGQVSRRDLVKWGLFTSAGLVAPIGGLSPFVRPMNAQTTSFSFGHAVVAVEFPRDCQVVRCLGSCLSRRQCPASMSSTEMLCLP